MGSPVGPVLDLAIGARGEVRVPEQDPHLIHDQGFNFSGGQGRERAVVGARLDPPAHVYARGTARGGGEGCAQGGVILKETGSETCDRRGEAQTRSASARRP